MHITVSVGVQEVVGNNEREHGHWCEVARLV